MEKLLSCKACRSLSLRLRRMESYSEELDPQHGVEELEGGIYLG